MCVPWYDEPIEEVFGVPNEPFEFRELTPEEEAEIERIEWEYDSYLARCADSAYIFVRKA